MSKLQVDEVVDSAGSGAVEFPTMPTVNSNPVVESGSNSDGEWTRFADGTQVCRAFNIQYTSWNSIPRTVTFPISFIDSNWAGVFVGASNDQTDYATIVQEVNTNTSKTTSQTEIRKSPEITDTGVTLQLSYHAAGRWL